MQISAHNVLATQQQAARAQKPAAAPFEPPELKKQEPTAETDATAIPAPTGYVRPGTHVDIKV